MPDDRPSSNNASRWSGLRRSALATALVVVGSEEYRQGNGAIGQRMLEIAAAKSSLGFGRAVLLGVVANALVCLAVWLSLAARTLTDKVVAVILPITAFVAGGFELIS